MDKKEYHKKYYQQNKERLKKYANIYRSNNKEKCQKLDSKKYQKNKEKYKLNANKWKLENPEKYKKSHRESQIRDYKMNKFKYQARAKARTIKVEAGQLCQICKDKLATERHHKNYNKQLSIQFLCSQCHRKLHRKFK